MKSRRLNPCSTTNVHNFFLLTKHWRISQKKCLKNNYLIISPDLLYMRCKLQSRLETEIVKTTLEKSTKIFIKEAKGILKKFRYSAKLNFSPELQKNGFIISLQKVIFLVFFIYIKNYQISMITLIIKKIVHIIVISIQIFTSFHRLIFELFSLTWNS